MRRWVVLGLLGFAFMAPAARAIPVGSTVLLDRPSGFGALPFDGISSSETSLHNITADGRFVVFSSQSNALLAGDEDTAENVYRLDLTNGKLVQVDKTSTGGQPTPGSQSDTVSISADGDHVGFRTTSPVLAPGASNDNPEFVVKNLVTGAVELASRSTGPAGAPAPADFGLVSGDGRHVVFTSSSVVHADNATGVTTTTDAYERSLDTNVTHMVSVTDPGGTEGGGVRDEPDIDFAGDAVAFATDQPLTAGDTDTQDDAYFHTVGGTEHTVLVSFSGGGQLSGADGASDVAISGRSATGLDLAWLNGATVYFAPCTAAACATPAVQADHARTGGTDDADNEPPLFPPQASGASVPTRVYWNTRDPLDPADTNNDFDLYGWDIGNNNFDASIHLMTGGNAIGGAFGGAATDNGSVTTFTADGSNLPGSDGLLSQAYIRRSGQDINISQPAGRPLQTDGAGFAFVEPLHATSDDGRIVAFSSDARAFGSPIGPEGPFDQVLIRNVESGQTRLVSAASNGAAGRGESDTPSVDAAGDRVAFQSDAPNFVAGDSNSTDDVFVRDLATGAITLVDRTDGGVVPHDGAFAPEISADGTKVVFTSNSNDIPGAPPDSRDHVYEVNLATGDVTLIDRSSAGAIGNGSAFSADIDGDGKRVAFVSAASNLGGGTLGSLYVRDLTNPAHPTTTWVSVPQDGMPAHDQARDESIDRNGGRVAFTESENGFGFGITPDRDQVFVRDLARRTTTLASRGTGGAANDGAGGPSISADGTRLLFGSEATNLPGAKPGFFNMFVRDLTRGTTTLASTRNGRVTSGRFGADGGSLSGNGACVAFASNSDDLVTGGYGSDFDHVFVHSLSAPCTASAVDTVPPIISQFRVTHKRFAVAGKPTALNAAGHKPPRGTTFTFSLSEPATTRIAVTHKAKGHRAGRNRPCKPARRGQRRNCTRTVRLLTLARAHTIEGPNRIAFSGRYGKKRLAPGVYTATMTATDAARNRSRPHSLSFTVVR